MILVHVLSDLLLSDLAGSRFKDAFEDPGLYVALEPLFEVCPDNFLSW